MNPSRKLKYILIAVIFLSCSKNDKLNYKFYGEDLCHDKNGVPIRFITNEDLDKNKGDNIIDKSVFEKNDSLIIKFKSFGACCQKPKDSVIIKKNRIIIISSFKSEMGGCDCECDYLFEYRIPKNEIGNKLIEIKSEYK